MHTTAIGKIGAYGGLLCTTTAAQTGTWMAITCVNSAACIFATLTELGFTRVGTIGSITFSTGVTIYGAFTNFTLTTGAVRCYNTRNMVANP